MYLDCVRIMGGMESLLLTTECKDTVEALWAGIRPPAKEPLLPWTSHFLSTSCSTTTTEAGAGSEPRPENISSSLFTAAACSAIVPQPMATSFRCEERPEARETRTSVARADRERTVGGGEDLPTAVGSDCARTSTTIDMLVILRIVLTHALRQNDGDEMIFACARDGG